MTPSDKQYFGLFNVNDSVVVLNPTDEDFPFMVGGTREYVVKAGEKRLLHGSAARLYVKKMLDYLFISNNEVKKLHNATAEAEKAQEIVLKVMSDDMAIDDETLQDLSEVVDKTVATTEKPDRQEQAPTDIEGHTAFKDTSGNTYESRVTASGATQRRKNGALISEVEFNAAFDKLGEQADLSDTAQNNDTAKPAIAKSPKEVAKEEVAFPEVQQG